MPIDYKLKTLRRLFGESTFLRPWQSDTISAAVSSTTTSTSPTTIPDPQSISATPTPTKPTTPRRRNKPPGGIPRFTSSGQPPRALKNKAVAGQLWGINLFEKQKMKVYYGAMRDKQFRRYVIRAKQSRYDIDARLMRMLELRLENFLYRTGFVISPMQARQWIFHGHVRINGRKAVSRNHPVQPGDVVDIADGFVRHAYTAQLEAAKYRKSFGMGASWLAGNRAEAAGYVPWMEVDRVGLAAALVRLPTNQEVRAMQRAALVPYIRDANMNPFAAMRSLR